MRRYTIPVVLCACGSVGPRAATPTPQLPPTSQPKPVADAAPAAPPPATTTIDHPELTLRVPGHWEDLAIEGGYDLRGDAEEIVVALFPLVGGDDADSSAAHLAEVQRAILRRRCTTGFALTDDTPTRFHATCTEPRFVATLAARPEGDRVLSYEHYRYAVSALTPELDAADAAIYASVHVRPRCPDAVVQGFASGGACLEASVLGDEITAACRAALMKQGGQRDPEMETALHAQTGKTLECYRGAP